MALSDTTVKQVLQDTSAYKRVHNKFGANAHKYMWISLYEHFLSWMLMLLKILV